MNILFIDPYGKKQAYHMNAVPRIGEQVEWIYAPAPKVVRVLWLVNTKDYDAVIELE